ncbi:MAG: laccase domain-containing protein [Pseudomonadota bacterium]
MWDCRSETQRHSVAASTTELPVRTLTPAAVGATRRDLRIAVTTRPGTPGAQPRQGLSDGANYALHVGDDTAAVHARRRALQLKLGVREIQWLDQRHTTALLLPGSMGSERPRETSPLGPVADGCLVSESGQAAAVLTADCLPVALWADVVGGPVACVHAGWQGLYNGILERAVRALRKHVALAVPLQGWIGPAICGAHYEVARPLALRFIERFGPVGVQASPRDPDRCQLCLVSVATRVLATAGVAGTRRSGWCTYSEVGSEVGSGVGKQGEPGGFYSHRRLQHEVPRAAGTAKTTGRVATLVWRS